MEDTLVVATGGRMGLLKQVALLGIPMVLELFSILTVIYSVEKIV